jgi:hypothetical protein
MSSTECSKVSIHPYPPIENSEGRDLLQTSIQKQIKLMEDRKEKPHCSFEDCKHEPRKRRDSIFKALQQRVSLFCN